MNKELEKEIDRNYRELSDGVMLVLTKYIPDIVTCPHCEREFVLTEVDWDKLVNELILYFVVEGGNDDTI